MHIQLISAGTATTSDPSAATDGVPLRDKQPGKTNMYWRGDDRAILLVTVTANAGQNPTMAGRLWGYSPITTKWHPLGTGATAAARGAINGGNTLTEETADAGIHHSEIVQGLSGFTRLALQVTTLTGTGKTVNAYIVAASPGVRRE